MKKILIVAIALISVFIFCGCGKFDITCSIDGDNNAEMKIEISIPKDGLTENEIESIQSSRNDLYSHWKGQGYEIKKGAIDKDSFNWVISKSFSAQSREEALTELLNIMGDESSPFSFAEGGYSSSYFSDVYNVKAEVDLSKIVDYEFIDTLPQSQRNKILGSVGAFSGTVSFNLFGEITDFTGHITDGVNTVSLNLDEPAEISSVLQILNNENKQDYDILTAEIAQLAKDAEMYTTIIIAAGSVALIIIIVTIILLILRKKKKKKQVEVQES